MQAVADRSALSNRDGQAEFSRDCRIDLCHVDRFGHPLLHPLDVGLRMILHGIPQFLHLVDSSTTPGSAA